MLCSPDTDPFPSNLLSCRLSQVHMFCWIPKHSHCWTLDECYKGSFYFFLYIYIIYFFVAVSFCLFYLWNNSLFPRALSTYTTWLHHWTTAWAVLKIHGTNHSPNEALLRTMFRGIGPVLRYFWFLGYSIAT